MSCNLRVKFPPETRVRDVAKVCGALAGFEVTINELSNDSSATEVANQSVNSCDHIPEMVAINLEDTCIDGLKQLHLI